MFLVFLKKFRSEDLGKNKVIVKVVNITLLIISVVTLIFSILGVVRFYPDWLILPLCIPFIGTIYMVNRSKDKKVSVTKGKVG